MILTMDVGNTNIKTALFDGTEMYKYWRMSTNITSTSDEYGVRLTSMFAHEGVSTDVVDGIVVSSVVPTINYTLEHMLQNYFGKTPLFVAPGVKTGINIKYENPRELGSDRIANAVAAYDEYGGPCIFIDFGTATTFGVIDAQRRFVGGLIIPGVKTSLNALSQRASQLPSITIEKPKHMVGRNTLECMQSGILYGTAAMIDGLLDRLLPTLDGPVHIIATGGMAKDIVPQCSHHIELDKYLLLKGLFKATHQK